MELVNLDRPDSTVPEEPEMLMTIAEAADLLRVSRSTIYKMCRSGEVPTWRPQRNRRVVRVPRRQLLHMIGNDTNSATGRVA